MLCVRFDLRGLWPRLLHWLWSGLLHVLAILVVRHVLVGIRLLRTEDLIVLILLCGEEVFGHHVEVVPEMAQRPSRSCLRETHRNHLLHRLGIWLYSLGPSLQSLNVLQATQNTSDALQTRAVLSILGELLEKLEDLASRASVHPLMRANFLYLQRLLGVGSLHHGLGRDGQLKLVFVFDLKLVVRDREQRVEHVFV